MNFRLTMVLVIVLLVTLGLWAKFHGGPAGGDAGRRGLKNALLTPQPKDVKAITFTQDGQKQVAFAHEGTRLDADLSGGGAGEHVGCQQHRGYAQIVTYKEKFEPESGALHTPGEHGDGQAAQCRDFRG